MSGEIRVYLPLQTEHLIALQDGEELETGLRGFAVTDQIRRAVAGDDVEEQEFLALQQAASSALAAGMPVLIGAADVPEAALTGVGPAAGPTLEVSVRLAARDFASFHLDDAALGRADAASAAATDE
ncbi:MAG: hypothetical protein WA892_04360, partial [Ornithinimicrobium sp.]